MGTSKKIVVVDSKWVNKHTYMTHVIFPALRSYPEEEVQNFYDYKNMTTNCVNLTKGKTYTTRSMVIEDGKLVVMRKNSPFRVQNFNAPEEELKPLSLKAQAMWNEYLNRVILDEDAST